MKGEPTSAKMPKNALKMLYLIVHFQKNFMGEAPWTPRCKEGGAAHPHTEFASFAPALAP